MPQLLLSLYEHSLCGDPRVSRFGCANLARGGVEYRGLHGTRGRSQEGRFSGFWTIRYDPTGQNVTERSVRSSLVWPMPGFGANCSQAAKSSSRTLRAAANCPQQCMPISHERHLLPRVKEESGLSRALTSKCLFFALKRRENFSPPTPSPRVSESSPSSIFRRISCFLRSKSSSRCSMRRSASRIASLAEGCVVARILKIG